ncbi:MAG: PEP-CTERM sorting domain-containing protein [Rubrivivax sp.]|nr:PEP-CTERM sorting domain-containing protein [Rubrivivax sp.]
MTQPANIAAAAHARHCPECGSVLAREHRHALDRWVSLFRTVHRYRCTNNACNWHGLMGRLPDEPRPLAVAAGRLLWFGLGVATALAIVLGLQKTRGTAPPSGAAAGASGAPVAPEPPWAARAANAAPPGVDFDGVPLADQHELVVNNPSPLTMRNHCAWGTPGGNPYKGTVEQALSALKLPPEIVRQVSDRAARGDMTAQLQITSNLIRSADGERRYSPRLRAMAFGQTICVDTRVNFKPGHVEFAPLYEATDRAGRTWSIMIPYVCQNVSVLGERGEVPPNGHRVPAPATWALVALGLGLLALGRRRRGADR